MALLDTPVCEFGVPAPDFDLSDPMGNRSTRDGVMGENGMLVAFICNHCPYVKAIIKDLVNDCNELKKIGINSVPICANDAENYPEDSFDKMIEFAKKNQFGFQTHQNWPKPY